MPEPRARLSRLPLSLFAVCCALGCNSESSTKGFPTPTSGGTSTSGGSSSAANTSAATNGTAVTNGTATSAATNGTASGGATSSAATNAGGADGTETTTTATTAGASASPIDRYGQLQVVAGRLSDSTGAPVTLRGQGFGWDNWWPQYYNADVVAWLRDDWCVDVVRPAMGIEPEGGYLENSAASKARIQSVVEAAIAKEIYVIIDWHAHDMHESEAVAFFSEMAQAYGDKPNVIYEVFNEPDDNETWSDVKTYAETVIAAIRQYDPDNIVIVGSPEWDQRIDLVAADPITSDTNVVYSLHFYAATHGQWLRDRANTVALAGIPLIVSESSGSDAAGQGTNDYTEWQAWFDLMEQQQISWVHYSVSDKAGETISVLEPGAAAQGGWDATQLTETGEYVRDLLRSHCD